ncbi:hypothetical protein BpHYR1_019485 [Brachionus plicatilis]|uniref:Uncharacterized protein n=1 Tax=Brachionus plicatilis TaxID=10195 RepID=A0A3M7RBQ1_BRAPC|nr:hypothetical protein BpHYR1_019485 [Brachionus plicatilis]
MYPMLLDFLPFCFILLHLFLEKQNNDSMIKCLFSGTKFDINNIDINIDKNRTIDMNNDFHLLTSDIYLVLALEIKSSIAELKSFILLYNIPLCKWYSGLLGLKDIAPAILCNASVVRLLRLRIKAPLRNCSAVSSNCSIRRLASGFSASILSAIDSKFYFIGLQVELGPQDI